MGLQEGTCLGVWKDGRNLVETIRVYVDRVEMTRAAGGVGQGVKSIYFKTGANTYRSHSGHVLFVSSSTSFPWTNSDGNNSVGYCNLS